MSDMNTGHVRYEEQHRATLGEKSKTLPNGVQKLWNFNQSLQTPKGRSPSSFSSKLESWKYCTCPRLIPDTCGIYEHISGKIDSNDQNSTKSTRIDLRFCREVPRGVEKITSEHQHPISSKSHTNSKSIKNGGVFLKLLKRMNFRARVESAQTIWWEWFSDVLAHFDTTQMPPKAQIQTNHQNQ